MHGGDEIIDEFFFESLLGFDIKRHRLDVVYLFPS